MGLKIKSLIQLDVYQAFNIRGGGGIRTPGTVARTSV